MRTPTRTQKHRMQIFGNRNLPENFLKGSGVTCATCHLPRMVDGKEVWVSHDQNANLRPNETMAREVCANCHGLEYSLSALADESLVESCYGEAPANANRKCANGARMVCRA